MRSTRHGHCVITYINVRPIDKNVGASVRVNSIRASPASVSKDCIVYHVDVVGKDQMNMPIRTVEECHTDDSDIKGVDQLDELRRLNRILRAPGLPHSALPVNDSAGGAGNKQIRYIPYEDNGAITCRLSHWRIERGYRVQRRVRCRHNPRTLVENNCQASRVADVDGGNEKSCVGRKDQART